MKIIQVPDDMLAQCTWCGEQYLKLRKDHKTCSGKCRKALSRHKAATRYHEKKEGQQKEEQQDD